MKKKTKILLKRLRILLSWVVIIAYMFVALSFASKENQRVNCKSIKIQVTDDTGNAFIEEDDVLDILDDKGINLIGQQMISVNREQLETTINYHPTIKSAQVYFTFKGELNINVTQRKPIVRVLNNNGESYYIDNEGFLMPLSDKFTARVLVANGNINEAFFKYYKANVLSESDTLKYKSEKLKSTFQLASFITSNKFWNAQIQQIYYEKNNDIELIPRVGTHIIVLGNMDNYQKKFSNLEAVYKYGFKKYGWNKYRIINLKYENQVICTKK